MDATIEPSVWNSSSHTRKQQFKMNISCQKGRSSREVFEEGFAHLDLLAWLHLPFLQVLRFNYHNDGRAQVKHAQFLPLAQMLLLSNVDSHHVERTHHHHRHQTLLPLGRHRHSSVLLVNGLSLGQSAFTNRIASSFNPLTAEDVDVGWRVEAVVVSRGQVDHQLEQLGVFAELEVFIDERGVLLGGPSHQLTQRILASLDCLAFISRNFLNYQDLSIAGRPHRIGEGFWKVSFNLSGKEGAEGRVFSQRQFYLFQIHLVYLGVCCKNGSSQQPRDLHFCDHFGLFAKCRLELVLGKSGSTRLQMREVKMVAVFLAKTDRRTMGRLFIILPE